MGNYKIMLSISSEPGIPGISGISSIPDIHNISAIPGWQHSSPRRFYSRLNLIEFGQFKPQ